MGSSEQKGWPESSAVAQFARLPRRAAPRNYSRCGTSGSGYGYSVRREQPVLGLPGGVREPLAHGSLATRLDFDPQAVGQAVHEIEHAGDGDGGQNLLISEPDGTQGADVGFAHQSRGQGELDRVVEDGAGLRVKVGLGVVVDDVAGVLRVAAMLTEEPSVSDGSIAAAVDQGDNRGDCLLLGTGERG